MRQLKQIQKMVSMLEREISYGILTLPEALLHTAKRMEEPFHSFLQYTARQTKNKMEQSFAQIWETAIANTLQESNLTSIDKDELKELGKYLGYLDVAMQKQMLQLYENELEVRVQEAADSLEKKKKLYRSMGVLCGLFLAVALY